MEISRHAGRGRAAAGTPAARRPRGTPAAATAAARRRSTAARRSARRARVRRRAPHARAGREPAPAGGGHGRREVDADVVADLDRQQHRRERAVVAPKAVQPHPRIAQRRKERREPALAAVAVGELVQRANASQGTGSRRARSSSRPPGRRAHRKDGRARRPSGASRSRAARCGRAPPARRSTRRSAARPSPPAARAGRHHHRAEPRVVARRAQPGADRVGPADRVAGPDVAVGEARRSTRPKPTTARRSSAASSITPP